MCICIRTQNYIQMHLSSFLGIILEGSCQPVLEWLFAHLVITRAKPCLALRALDRCFSSQEGLTLAGKMGRQKTRKEGEKSKQERKREGENGEMEEAEGEGKTGVERKKRKGKEREGRQGRRMEREGREEETEVGRGRGGKERN